MKKIKPLILVFLTFLTVTGFQRIKYERPLDAFTVFLGGEWVIQSDTDSGIQFEQKLVFERNLNGHIIETTSYNKRENNAWELRNKGVRYFDKSTQTIRFSEWTRFGDVTHGVVTVSGDSILLDYEYDGAAFRDLWVKQHKDTFNFQIGYVKDNKWEKLLLNTKAVRMRK